MGSLSDVLKRRRKELGLTLSQIADKMDVTEATVQRWESGNIKSIRHNKVTKLADILNVNPSELMGWDDTPVRPLPSNLEPVPAVSKIPLIGQIACGTPILAEENIADYVDLPEHIKADYALRCKGDSMINARIYDGDIVYIRQQPEVENGQIAAVRIGEEATLKKFYYNGKRVTLRACNPLYEDLEYEGEALKDVEVLGRAVAFTSIVRHSS